MAQCLTLRLELHMLLSMPAQPPYLEGGELHHGSGESACRLDLAIPISPGWCAPCGQPPRKPRTVSPSPAWTCSCAKHACSLSSSPRRKAPPKRQRKSGQLRWNGGITSPRARRRIAPVPASSQTAVFYGKGASANCGSASVSDSSWPASSGLPPSINRADSLMTESSFEMPSGVVRETICSDTKKLATPSCPQTETEIFNIKYLPPQCDKHGNGARSKNKTQF